ncbi:unnamed protein product [Periconia digitata]|uniref:Glycoside hydrolase 131 catalytic N-terminal domain-containing protein n=1 Tax=Periconia digitata TaxID=1303443 RepID=A0A9W4UCR5_9PLEO|nr:unnamed protein product [Periconia digitata]
MQYLLTVLAGASTALAAPALVQRANGTIQCPIVFDGRIPTSFSANPSLFDTYATNTIYNPDYVKGTDLKWSTILKFPGGAVSRFDGADHVPVEVTISDKSIFQTQKGFRRAGLQFLKDSADGEGQKGVKTLHFSVKQDAARPLNLTHEYLNVWHETADYSANQWNFQTGTIIGQSSANKEDFKIIDRNGKSLYAVKQDKSSWQNFALKFDYTKNQLTTYYSVGDAALKLVAGPTSTNLAGGGQFQIGILKKPTGTSDVVNGGYQESNLNEGQIYGGIFLEDSSDGCVSL